MIEKKKYGLWRGDTRKIYSEKAFRLYRRIQSQGLSNVSETSLLSALRKEKESRDCFVAEVLSGSMRVLKVSFYCNGRVLSTTVIGKNFGCNVDVIDNLIYFRTEDSEIMINRESEIDVFKTKEMFEVYVVC